LAGSNRQAVPIHGKRKVWLLPRRDVEQWKRSPTGRKPAK